MKTLVTASAQVDMLTGQYDSEIQKRIKAAPKRLAGGFSVGAPTADPRARLLGDGYGPRDTVAALIFGRDQRQDRNPSTALAG